MSFPAEEGVLLVAEGNAVSVFAFSSIPELEDRGPSAITSPGSSGGAFPVSLRNCSNSICEGSGKSSGGISFKFATGAAIVEVERRVKATCAAAGTTGVEVTGECRAGVEAAFAE